MRISVLQNVYTNKWIKVHYSKSYVKKINLHNSVGHCVVREREMASVQKGDNGVTSTLRGCKIKSNSLN